MCEYSEPDGTECTVDHPLEFDDQSQTREIDLGRFKKSDYDGLKADLRKRLEIFNQKLYEHNSSLVLTSPGRTPAAQHELHLCRMITWEIEDVKAYTKNQTEEESEKIQGNALDLLKSLRNLDDEAATKYAERRRNKVFKDNPVAAGQYPCPCGCTFRVSDHVSGRAADGIINPIDSSMKGISCNSQKASDAKLVDNLSKESDLVWGGVFKKIDRIHWQLPRKKA